MQKRAAQVAKFLEQDIDGIDVNMGCPRVLAERRNGGSSSSDKIVDILTALKAAVSNPSHLQDQNIS